MNLLLDDTNKELAAKNQQLASLKLLNHDLEQECSQVTEEIVVSVYCFYINVSIYLLTSTILFAAITSTET